MWRTAVEFEIEPPLNVTAPSDMATTPPSCAEPAQPRLLQSAAHPVRRHPPHVRIRPDSHAPLLRCRISPRRRTARCPRKWRARRRRTAHECIAPPLGRRKKPALCRIVQRTRSRHCTTDWTAVGCGTAARRRCSDATRADATRNARRCNMHIAHRTAHPVPHEPWWHRAACAAPCAPSIGRAAPRNIPYHGAGRATRAGCTHRRAARDRAALERDGPVGHGNHAAVALRTSRRSHAYCNRPRPPTPAPPRTGPPRTHRCFGVRYRHGVEQRGALGHGEHAAIGLRTSASHRRSATAKARPFAQSSSARAAARTTHHTAAVLRTTHRTAGAAGRLRSDDARRCKGATRADPNA